MLPPSPPPPPTPPTLDSFLALSPAELLARFVISVERFDRRVLTLSDEQLDMAFLEGAKTQDGVSVGRWPVRVLLGHLADAELAFVQRMRRVVAEDQPVLQAWDENAFIDAGIYGTDQTPAEKRQPIAAFVGTVFTLRKWTGEWLRTLEPAAFGRVGLHTTRGEQTLQMILAYDTWHLEHHAVYLNAKVTRFLGPPQPAPAQAAHTPHTHR